jgi:hypothetical protein
MKKKKKAINENIKSALIVSIVLLVLLAGISVKASGGSVWDIIGRVAGNILGNKLAEEIEGQDITLGAIPGGDVYTHLNAHNGITVGGRLATTTTVISAYTTTQKDFKGLPTYWDFNPGVNLTLTINATSTHGYVPNIGDVSKIYLRNASTTAGATITLAAEDSSVDLQTETGGDLVLNGLDWAELTLIREDTYKTTIIFDEFTEAD